MLPSFSTRTPSVHDECTMSASAEAASEKAVKKLTTAELDEAFTTATSTTLRFLRREWEARVSELRDLREKAPSAELDIIRSVSANLGKLERLAEEDWPTRREFLVALAGSFSFKTIFATLMSPDTGEPELALGIANALRATGPSTIPFRASPYQLILVHLYGMDPAQAKTNDDAVALCSAVERYYRAKGKASLTDSVAQLRIGEGGEDTSPSSDSVAGSESAQQQPAAETQQGAVAPPPQSAARDGGNTAPPWWPSAEERREYDAAFGPNREVTPSRDTRVKREDTRHVAASARERANIDENARVRANTPNAPPAQREPREPRDDESLWSLDFADDPGYVTLWRSATLRPNPNRATDVISGSKALSYQFLKVSQRFGGGNIAGEDPISTIHTRFFNLAARHSWTDGIALRYINMLYKESALAEYHSIVERAEPTALHEVFRAMEELFENDASRRTARDTLEKLKIDTSESVTRVEAAEAFIVAFTRIAERLYAGGKRPTNCDAELLGFINNGFQSAAWTKTVRVDIMSTAVKTTRDAFVSLRALAATEDTDAGNDVESFYAAGGYTAGGSAGGYTAGGSREKPASRSARHTPAYPKNRYGMQADRGFKTGIRNWAKIGTNGKNPLDRKTGKPMLCRSCGSDEHFRYSEKCPDHQERLRAGVAKTYMAEAWLQDVAAGATAEDLLHEILLSQQDGIEAPEEEVEAGFQTQ